MARRSKGRQSESEPFDASLLSFDENSRHSSEPHSYSASQRKSAQDVSGGTPGTGEGGRRLKQQAFFEEKRLREEEVSGGSLHRRHVADGLHALQHDRAT